MNKELGNKLLGVVGILTMGIVLGYIFFGVIDYRLEENEKLYTTKTDQLVGVLITSGEETVNKTQQEINKKEKIYGDIIKERGLDGISSKYKFEGLEGEVFSCIEDVQTDKITLENMVVYKESNDAQALMSYKIDLVVNSDSFKDNLVTYINPIFRTGENLVYVSSSNSKKIEYDKKTSEQEQILSANFDNKMFIKEYIRNNIKENVVMNVNICYKRLEQANNVGYYLPISSLGV